MTNLNKIFALLYPIAGIIFIVKVWMINSREFSSDFFFPILIFLILAWAIYFVATTYWKLAMTAIIAHGRKFMPTIGIIILCCAAIIYFIQLTTTDFGGIIAVPFIIIAVGLLIVTFISAVVVRIWNRKI